MAPALRGLLASRTKREFAIATVFSIACTVAWQLGMKSARIHQYEEFYKTFDPKAEFERLKKAGVYTSVLPDGSTGSGW